MYRLLVVTVDSFIKSKLSIGIYLLVYVVKVNKYYVKIYLLTFSACVQKCCWFNLFHLYSYLELLHLRLPVITPLFVLGILYYEILRRSIKRSVACYEGYDIGLLYRTFLLLYIVANIFSGSEGVKTK